MLDYQTPKANSRRSSLGTFIVFGLWLASVACFAGWFVCASGDVKFPLFLGSVGCALGNIVPLASFRDRIPTELATAAWILVGFGAILAAVFVALGFAMYSGAFKP